MKLKYLIAAMGLVASAASQAALIVPDTLGSGELALVVYDANASYTLDLGTSFSQFLANANTTNSNLATLGGANWSAFATAEAGNVSTWQYAVIGGRTDAFPANSAIISTINANDVGTIIGNYTSSTITGSVGQITPYYQNVNLTGTHPTTANGDSYNLVGSAAYYLTSHMDTFNQSLYTNSDLVGTAMQVEYVSRNAPPSSDPNDSQLAGLMSLAQVGGNYVLSYNVAAVPEAPGLTMSVAGLALVSFLTLRRRNRG